MKKFLEDAGFALGILGFTFAIIIAFAVAEVLILEALHYHG